MLLDDAELDEELLLVHEHEALSGYELDRLGCEAARGTIRLHQRLPWSVMRRVISPRNVIYSVVSHLIRKQKKTFVVLLCVAPLQLHVRVRPLIRCVALVVEDYVRRVRSFRRVIRQLLAVLAPLLFIFPLECRAEVICFHEMPLRIRAKITTRGLTGSQ